jgi:hypothetical protein
MGQMRLSFVDSGLVYRGVFYLFFINVCRKNVFDIHFTEFGAVMTTVLFQYCYTYCYSDSQSLWTVMRAGGLAL